MDFTLSEEQELLRDTAGKLLARLSPIASVRAHASDRSVAEGMWPQLAEWTDLGSGPLVDLCLFLEETGAVLTPGPFLTTTTLYAGLGLDGTGTVALAGDDGQWLPNPSAVKRFVLDADLVETVAFVLDGPQLAVVPAAALNLRPVELLDSSRRVFEVTAPDDLDVTLLDPDLLARALQRAWVGIAAELLGTSRWLFDTTLAYAKERVQFDRPIGSFQAIQHKLADMALVLDRARSAVYYAAMAVDAGDPDRGRAAHVAKAAAGAAATRCAKDGIQIHGGIGFTWEHDLHLFIRRAYTSEALLGSSSWHHDRLADLLLA
jgi:hypothetical protein